MNTNVTQPPVFSTPDKTTDLPVEMSIAQTPAPTKGEKATHFFAHWGIDFLANYILSIGITDIFKGHKVVDEAGVTSFLAHSSKSKTIHKISDTLREGYDGSIRGVARAATAAGASEKVAKTIGNNVVDMFTLMMGGNITAATTAYVMNRSDKWAKRFDGLLDKLHGHTPSPEEMAEREVRYDYLRNQPKISAGTVVKARAIGYLVNMTLPSLSSTLDWRAWGGKKPDAKYLGIRGATEYYGNKIAENRIAANPGMSELAKARWRYWSDIALFEAESTLNTSLVANFVMSKSQKRKDEKAARTVANPVATTTTYSVPAPTYTTSNTVSQEAETIKDKSAAVEESSATQWSDRKVTAQDPAQPREEIQPAEIRNQNTPQNVVYA